MRFGTAASPFVLVAPRVLASSIELSAEEQLEIWPQEFGYAPFDLRAELVSVAYGEAPCDDTCRGRLARRLRAEGRQMKASGDEEASPMLEFMCLRCRSFGTFMQ
eukprot:TRINITY_DN40854_c0_g1_i2.p1 TRINITY_DN40854_c0_g1~~TRINITY_DN40854_c0_g1_i2.p1  ORF type:complete len:105 (-),score=26.80 TRINITY_DN40854_c0_g1_i2:109-423(-)